MTFLRIAWAWVKKHWRLLLAILGAFIGYVVLRKAGVPNLTYLFQQINDDHRKDVEAIQKKNEEIAKQKEKIKQEEQQKLQDLDKKYDQLEKNLEEEQKKRVDEILTDSNTDELAEQLAKITGSKKLD